MAVLPPPTTAALLAHAPFLALLAAHGEEYGGEVFPQLVQEDVAPQALVGLEVHAGLQQALGLRFDNRRRQAIAGNGVQGAAGLGEGGVQGDVDAVAQQVIGGGQPGRPGAHHGDARRLDGRRRHGIGPAMGDGLVAEQALHVVDGDGLVELAAVAGGFAGVMTDTAGDGRQRVGHHQALPGLSQLTGVHQRQIGLRVLTRRAGAMAGGGVVLVLGLLHPP
jgi:hypothetical protein